MDRFFFNVGNLCKRTNIKMHRDNDELSQKTIFVPAQRTNVKKKTLHIPNVAKNYLFKTITIDDKEITFDLHDSAGGDQWSKFRPFLYPYCDVFLVCMSILDPRRYHWQKENNVINNYWTDLQIETMAYSQESKVFDNDIPTILVGTKIDLRDDDDLKIRKLCRSKQDMEYFQFQCKEYFDEYIECSSLQNKNINVKQVFELVARKAIKYKQRMNKNKKENKCIIQ